MKIDNILYRGKTKATNEWAFGDAFINGLDDVAIRAKYTYPSGNPTNRSKIEYLTPYEVLRVDPSTLDLYSGLNDKNDTKIFDGDIVRVKHEGKTYVGTISNDSYAVFGFIARSFGWIPLHDLITDSDIEKILVGNTLCIGAVEGCTTHLRSEELPRGRIVVNLSRHYAAIIDGDLHDTYDCTREGSRCVYGYFIKEAADNGGN